MKMLIYLLLTFSIICESKRKLLTEEEEAAYFEKIKEMELKLYEKEMRDQSALHGTPFDAAAYGISARYDSSSIHDIPKDLRTKTSRKELVSGRPQYAALYNEKANNIENTDLTNEDHWCYYCVTPVDKLRSETRKSVRTLLDMRRAPFPKDAVTTECHTARNFSKLSKQKCQYQYCQVITMLDKDAGQAFVVRGCAENFGAINIEEMEKKPDFSCEMLHEKLQIKECICRTAKYCKAGWSKRNVSSSPTKKLLLILIALILSIFKHF